MVAAGIPMIADSLPGRPVSLWMDTTDRTSYPALEGDLSTDVAVVGGGIAGVTTALNLRESGRSVVLLERDRMVEGVTGHTTAKLTSQHSLIYADLLARRGKEVARRYARANEDAKEAVAERIEDLDVDANFRRTAAYTYTDDRDSIEREVRTARELGLPASYVDEVALPFTDEPAIRFDDQAEFHPRTYLLALLEEFESLGGEVFERTRALDVDPGEPSRVETDRGTVTADSVVIATHFPFFDRGLFFARMYPKRSYVLAVRVADPPEGMYYRASDPYFSVRPWAAGEEDLVLIGGQNHKTGQGDSTAERYRTLARHAHERFEVESIEYRWSTQDYVTLDRAPFVGRVGSLAENVLVATGFGGWGMTGGVGAGRMLAELLKEGSHPYEELFDPGRSLPSPKTLGTAVAENVDAVSHFIGDRARSLVAGTEPPEPGSAKIVRDGAGPVGQYRDEDGTLHAVSVVCPHKRCVLRWNDGERTWDCPCHGSRFDPDGTVLDGPAVEDLPEREK